MSFVISKTRLASIKTLTIPRLELQAAVVTARLKTKILEEIDFEVNEMYFWSDSKIVLHYLSDANRRFSVYVSHRVAKITSKSDMNEWHHIPGTMNVADDCTRGKEIQLLTLPEEEWPSFKEAVQVNESELEVRASVLTTWTAPYMFVVEWEKYSTWNRLIWLCAWWITYKFKLRSKARRRSPPPEQLTKSLCADDLKESSLALCMIAQIESFEEEYKELQANRALSSNSPQLRLQPFLMEGVIRVGGRLNKAWIPFEAKHQAVLSPTHPLTRLLVQDLHEKHSHVGREHTLALVCQHYWIPRGKSFVRKIVNDCLHCKRRLANPNVPLMASLPEERLAFGKPPFAIHWRGLFRSDKC